MAFRHVPCTKPDKRLFRRGATLDSPMRLVTLTLLLTLAACAEEAGLAANGTDMDADMPEGDPEPTDDDMGAAIEADLMSLDGTVIVNEGLIDLGLSELEITLFAGSEPLCTGMLVLDESEPVELDSDDVDASSAWELEVSAGAEALDACALPPTLSLTLGAVPYDAALAPAAESAGFEDSAGSVYGAVAQLAPSEPVYLFGLLGTDAQFDGDVAADPAAPLEDGAYSLETLYLLPLPPG